jgi:hypothetical protein
MADNVKLPPEFPTTVEVDAPEFEAPILNVRHSPTIGKLVAALALAQLEFKPIVKDTENPYYHSKYADLATVIAATQPALAKNGLVILQMPIANVEAHALTLTSILAHSSGEWFSNDLVLPAEMASRDGKMRFDSQSVGAAMTYARRYSYQGLTGTAAETDDDANAAVGIGSKEAAQQVAKDKLEAYKAREAAQMKDVQDHKFFVGDTPAKGFTQAASPKTVAAALPSQKFSRDTANTVRGLLVKVAEAKSKSGVYLRLRVGDTEMSLWDNVKFEAPVRGCKDLFSLLATSINETCDFEIDTKPGPAGKTYINVRVKSATMLIGPVEIDDCLPVMQRREPGE